jgi:nicotinamidase-related amidase
MPDTAILVIDYTANFLNPNQKIFEKLGFTLDSANSIKGNIDKLTCQYKDTAVIINVNSVNWTIENVDPIIKQYHGFGRSYD